jgi:tetratricopeptide (TPR) repeat protein
MESPEQAGYSPQHLSRNMLSPFGGGESPMFAAGEGEDSSAWQSDEEDLFVDEKSAEDEGARFTQMGAAAEISSHTSKSGGLHSSMQSERRMWRGVPGAQFGTISSTGIISNAARQQSEEALEREVLSLDSKYRELVRKGYLVDASEHLEKSLFARVKMFGADSAEVDKAARALVTHYNTAGMMLLQAGNFKLSFELLRKGEVLTGKHGPLHSAESRKRLRAVSLNNMGCFYRRRKKLHAALRYLEQALELELSISGAPISPAGTHLNICAVLSELRHHDAALVHANAALHLLIPLYGGESWRDNENWRERESAPDDRSISSVASDGDFARIASDGEFAPSAG